MNYEPQKSKSLFDPKILLRWFFAILFVFLAGAFQTSFFSASGLFKATPDLLITAVAALALFGGEKIGSVCGLIAGILLISLGGSGTALFPVLYCLEGWFFGLLGKNGVRKNVISWTLYAVPILLVRSLISLIYVFSSETSINLPKLFRGIIFPEFLISLICSYFSLFFAFLIIRLTADMTLADSDIQN